jgi:hypothetical protein
MIFWPKRDVNVGPLHFSSRLDALSLADLMFKLLPLCLRGDGHAAPKDHVDLTHLILIVRIGSMMFASSWLLCRWWHLLVV